LPGLSLFLIFWVYVATFDLHGQMAALAGFVSKMGLASGPLVGSLFIMSNGFGYIINLATIALLAALILSVYVSKNHEST